MLYKIVYTLAAATALCVVCVRSQAQNCQNNFVLSLYQCLSNRSIDRENFLWVTRNGTLGREPADLQSFTSRVCIEKMGLQMCVKTALDNAIALADDQCSQPQKTSLTSLFKGIFKNLEAKCRDPCRASFASELAKCYTDKMFNGEDYLLFNVSSKRDAILGRNSSEVERFCQERSSIMQCLKTSALNCNDATFMLRSFGLDFQALNDTYNVLCNYTEGNNHTCDVLCNHTDSINNKYNVLCNYTEVYMDQASCFSEQTQLFRTCRDAASNRVASIEIALSDFNITDAKFSDDICNLRFNQIQCEATAARQLNDTSKCPRVVLGLRKQQECMLVPYDCRIKTPSRLATACKMADFLIPDRENYKPNSAHALTQAQTQIVLLIVCIISRLYNI
ncbi:hypothetical protein PoB_003228500 [Plakobranchus ocellatus]|uniref:DUF19 domain-containing protein n=1 Tax=Plakobranchus ocellatus TaxID=259542 RepID=A0AAV4AEG6_9GAST|nr:hypothetical protein PoB_003228500 [Plakobranchus ocellatus]